ISNARRDAGLLQRGVFLARLAENGKVGVGAGPDCEQRFVRRAAFRDRAGARVGSTETGRAFARGRRRGKLT
ncbi:MAG: hypothetical protein M3541_08890, partial [Acidobacteriota bacterium]|nr:hypothetical protein [Acidobacteriota bacterium]